MALKLSDLITNTTSIAAAAAPSQFAMHALNRDSNGMLTYTKVLWANTSESVQLTNGSDLLAYNGMEEFIEGVTPSGVLHNSLNINVDENNNKSILANTFIVRVIDLATSPKYTFNGSNGNIQLVLEMGVTYTFDTSDFSTVGFPFYISTTAGDTNYTNEWTKGVKNSKSANIGVTNTSVTSMPLIFTVPFDAPSTLYYSCGSNASCSGTIEIRPASVNLANRKYEQVRFDNQQLTYYVNSQGFLVARYGAEYNYT